MNGVYIEQLQEYAKLTKCSLKIALYWARWKIWSVISPDGLIRDGNKLSIDMVRAARINEFSSLGDRTVGTKPPLVLRFITDPTRPRHVTEDGHAQVTIARAAIFCADQEITDSVEMNIAWILMQFGDWEISPLKAVMSDRNVEAFEFEWTPRERLNEGFEMIGTLSSIFARY